MDVVQQPLLVVYENVEQSVESPCINTATEIQCTMPRLDNLLTTLVIYTVLVDNAEGPDITDFSLQIQLQPNPEFLVDGSALQNNEYQPGSEAVIQIVVITLMICTCMSM